MDLCHWAMEQRDLDVEVVLIWVYIPIGTLQQVALPVVPAGTYWRVAAATVIVADIPTRLLSASSLHPSHPSGFGGFQGSLGVGQQYVVPAASLNPSAPPYQGGGAGPETPCAMLPDELTFSPTASPTGTFARQKHERAHADSSY